MSIIVHDDRIEIFKFASSGVIDLCYEVADFVGSGGVEKYDLIPGSATFKSDSDGIYVVIRRMRPQHDPAETPLWQVRQEMRRQAQEKINGRANWERERGPSTKPLPKVEVDPHDLLRVLGNAEEGNPEPQWHYTGGLQMRMEDR